MRQEFDLPGDGERFSQLDRAFDVLRERFVMHARLFRADQPKKVWIFVSKQDHCLTELLWQWKAGELQADLRGVVSNHPDLRDEVERYGVSYFHVPVGKDDKSEAEQKGLALTHDADLVVLARYMQILGPKVVAAFPNRIINIHHSFLPAFVGANPYAQAYARGVKRIGATAHYVTEELDAGPIIEQDVHRIGHRDGVEDLKRIGRLVERTVLARAVRWHLEDRILVHGNKTVVFA